MARFTIATLGAPTHVSAALAAEYAAYLTDSAASDEALIAGAPPAAGSAAYYRRSSALAAPRWSGGGLARLGLRAGDTVNTEDLAVMLAGRLPATGERLLSAAGSHGRVHLAAGRPTLERAGAAALYDARDGQARCRLRPEDWDAAVAQAAAPGRLVDGVAMWTKAELNQIAATDTSRVETLRRLQHTPGLALTIQQAADLTGFSETYLKRMCANYSPGDDAGGQWIKARQEPIATGGTRLRWIIERSDLAEFLLRRRPPATRFCYDATFTLAKSVSLLGLLGSDRLRTEVIAAVQQANQTGIDHLNVHASSARVTEGKRVRVIQSDGLAVASYMHATSRADDPALHIHNVILNAVRCEDGIDRALNAVALHRESATASALAEAELRWQLVRRLGVVFVPKDDTRDIFEVEGFSVEMLAAFSKRRAEIEDALSELRRLHGYPERDAAALATRQPKTGADPERLRRRWLDEAAALGVSPEDLEALCDSAAPPAHLSPDERAQLWEFLASEHGAARNHSVFTRADVYKAALRWVPEESESARAMPAATLDVEVTAWLASLRVIPLQAEAAAALHAGRAIGGITEPLYTTPEQVEQQQAIESAWEAGLEAAAGLCPVGTVAQVVREAAADGRPLSAEQRRLLEQWCCSGHRYQAAVGRPGAGKTFTMRSAAEAWRRAGYEVLGCAVKGEAARLLGAEAQIDSETVAMRLAQIRSGKVRLHSRSVVVVDEASTLSDADLRALIEAVESSGAALRTLGDPAQHTSVAAAGMWAHLVDRYGAHTPELSEHRRLQDAREAEAADLAREGRVKDAFEALRSAGRLSEAEGTGAYTAAVSRWMRLRADDKSAPIVTRDNATRRALNELCQSLLLDAGKIDAPVSYGGVRLGVGDEVLARRTDRLRTAGGPGSYIRNGARGRVVSTTAASAAVDFEGIGTIELPSAWVARGGADLAYAVTSYAVQGATQPASTSVISAGATLPELVVDITRGRTDNHVILTTGADSELSRWRVGPEDLTEEISRSIRPLDLTPAVHADSTLTVPEALWAADSLAALDAAAVDGRLNEHQAQVFETRRLRRIALLSRRDPSAVLGPGPEPPSAPSHLHHTRADAAEAVTRYRDRYGPRRSGPGPHSSLLGADPGDCIEQPQRRRWYDAALNALRRVARALKAHSDRGGLPPPRTQPSPTTPQPVRDWSDTAEKTTMQLQAATVNHDLDDYLVAQAEPEEIDMML